VLADSCDWDKVVIMSPGNGRLAEAAVRLFALMRQMDEDPEIDVIVAEELPENGIGAAMMDRLRRAAAKR
jgi:L-threonylcarbamoyladenylate synthase